MVQTEHEGAELLARKRAALRAIAALHAQQAACRLAPVQELPEDLEGEAVRLYALAGIDPARPRGARALASGLLGPDAIRHDGRWMTGAASMVRIGDVWQIFLRPGLRPHVEELALHHEIAEWALRNRPPDELREQAADQLAYRLRMPRAGFRALVRHVGLDLAALAEPWLASESAAALRWSEVTGTPLVLITPQSIRARGEDWAWPDEGELRRLARARKLPAGVRRVPIGDRRGTCALLAE